MPFAHLAPYAEDHGLSHDTAVAVFGMAGIGSAIGRFLLGSVADRIGRRSLLAAVFAGLALGGAAGSFLGPKLAGDALQNRLISSPADLKIRRRA